VVIHAILVALEMLCAHLSPPVPSATCFALLLDIDQVTEIFALWINSPAKLVVLLRRALELFTSRALVAIIFAQLVEGITFANDLALALSSARRVVTTPIFLRSEDISAAASELARDSGRHGGCRYWWWGFDHWTFWQVLQSRITREEEIAASAAFARLEGDFDGVCVFE